MRAASVAFEKRDPFEVVVQKMWQNGVGMHYKSLQCIAQWASGSGYYIILSSNCGSTERSFPERRRKNDYCPVFVFLVGANGHKRMMSLDLVRKDVMEERLIFGLG